LCPRCSSSVVLSLARYQLDGMLVNTAYLQTSSHRQIVQCSGHSSAPRKLSTSWVLLILMSCMSTCILPTWAQVWAVVWVAQRVLQRCSRIVGRCCRRREFSLSNLYDWTHSYLFKLHQHDRWLGQFVTLVIQWSRQDSCRCRVSVMITTHGTQANLSHRQHNGLAIPQNRMRYHTVRQS
jgi:hypothetical protein